MEYNLYLAVIARSPRIHPWVSHTLVPEKDKFIDEQSRRFKVKNWTSNPHNPMPCIMTGYMPAFLI